MGVGDRNCPGPAPRPARSWDTVGANCRRGKDGSPDGMGFEPSWKEESRSDGPQGVESRMLDWSRAKPGDACCRRGSGDNGLAGKLEREAGTGGA